jgi:deoxyribodipyrimidine photo-lyase
MGFNLSFRQPETYDKFESLPDWARKTLDEHASDERPYLYSLEDFESASTHDELWNAAQRELVQTGVMHNYMRMLWGKKILHWTQSPRQALAIMEHLNNKYGLDGRDPNSYSGIFWVLGRYDRAWGPKRPIFGSVRYMTSDSAAKKLRLKKYVERFADPKG